MKISKILKNDLKVFVRDIRSFILLFLTPICIVILIGSAFLSTEPRNVPIIVCGEENEFYGNFIGLVKTSEVFEIEEQHLNCEELISDQLSYGKVRAGVLTPANEFEDEVNVYIDNTKPISVYIESYFNFLMKDLSKKIYTNIFMKMVSDVKNASREINKTYDELTLGQNQIDVIISDINSLQSTVKENREKISDLKDARDKLNSAVISMGTDREKITEFHTVIDDIESDISALSLLIADNESNQSSEMQQRLNLIQNSIDDLRLMVDQENEHLSTTENYINLAKNSMNTVDFDTIENEFDDIDLSINLASSELRSLKEKLGELKDKLNAAKSYISSITEQDAERYLNPIESSIERYFGKKKYIDFVFPSILIMILMLMSTFLSSIAFIRQRNSGMMKRMAITPTGKNFFLLENTIKNIIISIIPLPFILIAGYLVLGVQITMSNILPIVLICGVSVIIFILLGLIIASFSKTETTAILSSLIIITPMIFLSGAFSPSEAFAGAIKGISAFLPMTISSRLLEGFMFYELPSAQMVTLFSYLFVYIIIAFLLVRIAMVKGFKQ